MGTNQNIQNKNASTMRILLYAILCLELIFTLERQLFDLMGYMWLPILVNFVNCLFIIFAIFGLHQCRRCYIISYLSWDVLWIGWNIFLVCYFLNIGILDRTQDLLSFNTGSFSWWLANGYGCRADYFQNITETEFSEGYYFPPRPSVVRGCALDYQYVETLHSGINGIVAFLAFLGSIHQLIVYVNPACARRRLLKRKRKNGESKSNGLYSIEYSPQVNNNGDSDLYANSVIEEMTFSNNRPNPGQMTPRRVKRRSHGRSSTRSVGHNNQNSSLNRNRRMSTRSTGHIPNKSKASNPVTRLLDTAHHFPASKGHNGAVSNGFDSSTSNDDGLRDHQSVSLTYGQINPGFESSRPNSIYSSSINNGQTTSMFPGGSEQMQNRNNYSQVKGSRPPSVLTSYSNFHGQRRTTHNPPLPVIPSQSGTLDSQLKQNTLTQENFVAPKPNPMANSSFDDLPPPPPPIASESPNLSDQRTLKLGGGVGPQLPVPQKRQNGFSNGYSNDYQNHERDFSNNDYINMHISSNHTNSSSPPSSGDNMNNMQTLRVNDRLLAPPPLPSHGGRDPQRKPKNLDETDYGFSTRRTNGGPSSSHSQQDSQQSDQQKWYLKDSMKPVGALVHGGNCKCYRCQRKLTAI